MSSRLTISPFDCHSYPLSRRRSRISRSSFSLNRPLAFPIHLNDVHIVQRTFRRRFPAVLRRRFIVERRGIEPRLPGCKPSVFPLDQRPVVLKRSVRELNPVFRLTTAACCRNTYRPVVKSDPGWNRTSTLLHVTQASSPLDHGIVFSVTRVGVEPTKSPRPQRDRFTCLRTWSFRKWRVRGLHPAVPAYEARMSTGPPATSCRSRYRAERTGRMKASWTPVAPAMFK